jgi:carbamoyl-phosphate synthase small subunit
MRAGISTMTASADTLRARVLAGPRMAGSDLTAEVTTSHPYVVRPDGERRFTVAAIDLGIKAMTPHRLAQRGIETHVLPASSGIDDVLALEPDGLFMSNGPGDPATAGHAVDLLTEALERRLPFFGICFGHQVLGRALGFGTYKLGFGHRGVNLPVQDRATGKVEITAHNHGFAVEASPDRVTRTQFGVAEVSHICLNDDVVEGLTVRGRGGRTRAFSVQYHPEAAAGPHDAEYLFDRFVDVIRAAES